MSSEPEPSRLALLETGLCKRHDFAVRPIGPIDPDLPEALEGEDRGAVVHGPLQMSQILPFVQASFSEQANLANPAVVPVNPGPQDFEDVVDTCEHECSQKAQNPPAGSQRRIDQEKQNDKDEPH